MKQKTTRLRVRLEERKRRSTTPPPASYEPRDESPPPTERQESPFDHRAEHMPREPRANESTKPGLQPRNAQTLRLDRASFQGDARRPADAPTTSRPTLAYQPPNAPHAPSHSHPQNYPSNDRANSPAPPPPAFSPATSYAHAPSQPHQHTAGQGHHSQGAQGAHAAHGAHSAHGPHDDNLDNEFFSTPPPPQHVEHEDDLHDGNFEEWERARRSRRARFIRPVAWVVGVCVVIGVAATVRHYITKNPELLARSSATSPTGSNGAPALSASVQNTPIATGSGAGSSVATAATTAALDAGVATADGLDAAAGALAAMSSDASTDASALASAVEDAGGVIAHSPEEAAKEKKRAQHALDSGRLKEAIAAGERSVALDPEDAEAWLLLGASYQEAGDRTNASRCFRACLTQAKRGDRSDCSAMLR